MINDSLGYSLGDKLLRMLADRMRQCIRDGDVPARLGGDEFVVLLPRIAGTARASEIAEAILDVITSPFTLEGRELNVTASVGIAIYPDDGEDVSELLRNADSAMYHAKASGRGCYEFFAPAMNVAVRHRLELDNDLRGALRRNEFFLHYQPFVDTSSNRIVAFEALLHWEHPRDDFGIGYSSLSYLKNLPIRKLEIDRSFVAGVSENRSDAAIVVAIAGMARSLDLELTGEGVETAAQIDFLQAQGCNRLQGYCFSEPLPQAAATELLSTERKRLSAGS